MKSLFRVVIFAESQKKGMFNDMRTVAEILALNFKNMGVRHAFGVPGKAVVPILLQLEINGIQFNLIRHEAGGWLYCFWLLINE